MFLSKLHHQLNYIFSAWAPLPLRLALGVIFFAHGADKLFGWFGSDGFAGTVGFMQSLGLHPAPLFAALAGGGEMVGGILVFFGLFTRFGGFLIASTMVVAIVSVHLSAGLFAKDGGFEYPLTALAAAVALMLSGGQRFSLDALLFRGKQSVSPDLITRVS